MKLGIIAPAGDPQATTLHQLLNEREADVCHFLAFPERGTPCVGLDEDGVYWDAINVAKLDAVYVHGYTFMSPVIPPLVGETDWSLWQTGHISEQQKYSFFTSAYAELERHGVRVYNGIQAHIRGFSQANLLESLRDQGFHVPRLLYTNEDAQAQAALDTWQQVLWRPGTGRAAWQFFLAPQREFLMDRSKAPVLLAEIIEGPLVRAYVLDGKALLCLGRNVPALLPLETLEVVQALELPEVQDVFQRLAEATGLRWMQVNFAFHEKQVWIYDIDVDPILEWLPHDYRQTLLERLADGLLKRESDRVPAPTQAQARSMLFLRRMLTPLFELEQMKYRRRS